MPRDWSMATPCSCQSLATWQWGAAASFHAALPRLLARPPWAGDLFLPLDHGAAGPAGPIAMAYLQACFGTPPLAPPFAPPDRPHLNLWVGHVLPPSPPPPPMGRPWLCPSPRLGGMLTEPPHPCATALRGRGTPPGAAASGDGQHHIPPPALAHDRSVAGGRGAGLRNPPHGSRTPSDARPDRGLGMVGIRGGSL